MISNPIRMGLIQQPAAFYQKPPLLRSYHFRLGNFDISFVFQTTVVDACEDLRKKLTEIKGLGPSAQYGLFLADEDPKRGVWLDSGRTLEHYLLRENVSKLTLLTSIPNFITLDLH